MQLRYYTENSSLSLFLSRLRASVDKLSDIFSLNQDICIKLLES